jgi:hypothetical protein
VKSNIHVGRRALAPGPKAACRKTRPRAGQRRIWPIVRRAREVLAVFALHGAACRRVRFSPGEQAEAEAGLVAVAMGNSNRGRCDVAAIGLQSRKRSARRTTPSDGSCTALSEQTVPAAATAGDAAAPSAPGSTEEAEQTGN